MDSTPIKKSLRLTTRGKSRTIPNDETPKKVRFSMQQEKCTSEEKKNVERIYSAEDVLSMIQDSSLSDVETSSDEEWIVTKSKAIYSSGTPKCKENTQSKTAHKQKKDKEVVSPLKLLRKPEYEVNKLPSAFKKSESAVSPIIIKRKTDLKTKDKDPSPAEEALTPSSKNNIVCGNDVFHNSPKKSLRGTHTCVDDEDNIENEFTTKSIKTPKKKSTNTPGKQKVGRKLKEKRNNNDFEELLVDEISELHLQTPKKYVESGTTSTLIVEDVSTTSPNETTVIKTVSYKHQTIITSPRRCVSPSEEIEKQNLHSSKNLRTPKRSSSRKFMMEINNTYGQLTSNSTKELKVQVSDSDEELNGAPSPPKRRSLRTPKGKALSPAPVQRSTRKSSQKALCAILSKEDYEMELSSPDEKKTPRRSIAKQRSAADSPSLRRQVLTPKASARKKLDLTSPVSVKKLASGSFTPLKQEKVRRSLMGTPGTPVEEARARLHTGTVPDSLPCREEEFSTIFQFLSRRIEDRSGGCMYISGVPGTGKTATVSAVVRSLKKEAMLGDLPTFNYIELNGLRVSDPRQAYINIWQELSGQKVSGDIASQELERKFNSVNKKPCVILIDELDYLCNKRQDVIYNILEWSTKSTAALSVLTIANTMDLPERTLKTKINSRMGLRKVVFQPYTFQQLEKIVMDRIRGNPCFHPDAIQFVARKVAAVSGDARRALDICRRATEMISENGDIQVIEVAHINNIMTNIFSGARIKAIQNCSVVEKLVLRAILSEVKRTGVEETTVEQVHLQLFSLCTYEGVSVPVLESIHDICSSLVDAGLILAESSRGDLQRKLSLNVSEDDIHYSLNANDSQ